jgi:hypothetical protein
LCKWEILGILKVNALQGGYHIMRKSKLYKSLCLTLGLGIALSGVASQAASITKTLRAVYNNIAITFNGQAKTLSEKPFTVNGTTYVPLRAVSEIIGAEVSWVNNTIAINMPTGSSGSYEQEIAAKNYENALLRQQLEIAKRDLAALTGVEGEGNNLTTASVEKTLSKIKADYGTASNVEWEFGLKVVLGRLDLTIAYDGQYDETDFQKMTENQRNQFIKKICQDIATNHKDTEVRGIIKEDRNSLERASFRYTQGGSYEYKETTHFSLDNLEKELEKKYTVINSIGFSIPINYIELKEKGDELTFTVGTALRPSGTSDDFTERWNDLNSSDRQELEYIFNNIKTDIIHQTDSYESITGVFRDTSTGSSLGTYEKSGKFYLNAINTN